MWRTRRVVLLTAEMKSSRWCLCLTLVFIHIVCCAGEGVGTKCWSCDYNSTSCRDPPGVRYIPDVPTDNDFCKKLRNVTYILRDLCRAYPYGYHVLCERGDHSEISCKDSAICRLEPAFHTGLNPAHRPFLSPALYLVIVAIALTRSGLLPKGPRMSAAARV